MKITNRQRPRATVWSALLLLGLAGVAAANPVYRWVDANGRVHYGDAPPVAAKSSEVAPAIGAKPKTAAADSAKAGAADSCAQARKTLDSYTSASRISEVDPVTGEAQVIDGARRQQMIDAANDKVRRLCADQHSDNLN